MRQLTLSIVLGVLILIVGIVSGVAGLLLWPLVGVVVVIGLVLWFIKRGTEGKPPFG